MSTRYITLRQSDPRFSVYLWGRQTDALRAVPVKTYNLGTPEETVTFELKDRADIAPPGFFTFLAAFIKLRSFVLILFPLFYVLAKNYADQRFFDPLSMSFAAVAMLFMFAGLNIRNDINDHISGFDRVNMDSAPKPLRLGWISARRAALISNLCMAAAALLAFPVCLLQRELVRVLGVVLIFFFLGQFARNNSYKEQHFGEFILFLLMGPALVSGYQVALGAGIDTEVLCFGVLWGSVVLYLIQVNNFAHIMTSSQSGIRNTVTKLGFDLAQRFLLLFWGGVIVLWALFQYHFSGRYWTVLGTLLLVFWSIPLFLRISAIQSPIGSGPRMIRREARKAFLGLVFISLLQILWFLWDRIA